MQTKRLRRLRGVRLFSRSCSLQRRKYDGTSTIDDVFATDRISKAIDINGRQRVFHPICRVSLGTATVDENNPQRMVKLARYDGFISHDIGHEPSPNGVPVADEYMRRLVFKTHVSTFRRIDDRNVRTSRVGPCPSRFVRTVPRCRPQRRSSDRETDKIQIYSFTPSFGASSRRCKRSFPANFPRCCSTAFSGGHRFERIQILADDRIEKQTR